MKSCPKCGRQVKEDAEMCSHCGHQFDRGQALYRKSTDEDMQTNNIKIRKNGAVGNWFLHNNLNHYIVLFYYGILIHLKHKLKF